MTELDPAWAPYIKENPYVLVVLALASVVTVIRLLMQHGRRDLVKWPLGVALVVASLLVAVGIYVIVSTHPAERRATVQHPAAPVVSASAPPAPKNVQIVQGNNNTVIAQ